MVARLKVLLCIFFSTFLFLSVSPAQVEDAYVTKTAGGDFQVKLGFSNNFVAKASFANGVNETG